MKEYLLRLPIPINFSLDGSEKVPIIQKGKEILVNYSTLLGDKFIPYTNASLPVDLGIQNFSTSGNVNIGNASAINQKIVRIGQGTSFLDFGQVATDFGGIWFGSNTIPTNPSPTNYTFGGDGNYAIINAPSISTLIRVGGSDVTAFNTLGANILGKLVIGNLNTLPVGINFHNNKNLTGAVNFSDNYSDGVVQSDVTGTTGYYQTVVSTQAASFISNAIIHYGAAQGTFGAGSSVTTQAGFRAAATLIGATNNYGFYGQLAASSGRWNLYMEGTAQNYIAGNLGLGVTIPVASRLHIGGSTTSLSQMNLVTGTAPTSPNDGDIWREDNTNTGLKIRVNGVTKTITLG